MGVGIEGTRMLGEGLKVNTALTSLKLERSRMNR